MLGYIAAVRMIQMVATSVLVSGDARLKILGEHLIREGGGASKNGVAQDSIHGNGHTTGVGEADGGEGELNISVPTKYVIKWCTGVDDSSSRRSVGVAGGSKDTATTDNSSNGSGPGQGEPTLKTGAPGSPVAALADRGLLLTFDPSSSSFHPSPLLSSTFSPPAHPVDPYLLTTPPGKQPLQFLDLSPAGGPAARAGNVLFGIFEFEFSEDGDQIVAHTIQNVEILSNEDKEVVYDENGVPCL